MILTVFGCILAGCLAVWVAGLIALHWKKVLIALGVLCCLYTGYWVWVLHEKDSFDKRYAEGGREVELYQAACDWQFRDSQYALDRCNQLLREYPSSWLAGKTKDMRLFLLKVYPRLLDSTSAPTPSPQPKIHQTKPETWLVEK